MHIIAEEAGYGAISRDVFMECQIIDETHHSFFPLPNTQHELVSCIMWRKLPEFKQLKSLKGTICGSM
jgi:hypothetical protein